LHIDVLPHKFTQAYWIVGTLTTVVFILIIPFSALFVRRRCHELFLNLHVILAIIALGDCYYHIYLKFEHVWGYKNWIYIAVLFWGIEKGVRAIKIMKNGFKTAVITTIDEYIRVDVPSVQATGHVYLYFPTLSWRFWENHPFSIASSVYEYKESDLEEHVHPNIPVFELVGSDSDSNAESEVGEGHMLNDMEKHPNGDETTSSVSETPLLPETSQLIVGPQSTPYHDGSEERDSPERRNIYTSKSFSSGLTFYSPSEYVLAFSLNFRG
jgi:FAD-binding domain